MLTWLMAAGLLAAGATSPEREIVVSANDGKPVRPGDTAAGAIPDVLMVMAVERGLLRRLGEVRVPASMTGPPESVKLTPDGRYAILTSAQRIKGSPPPLLEPDDTVSVVDLADPRHPRLVQSLRAGAGAAGVAVNRAGTLVLVANGGADSVSAFAMADGRLTPAGTLTMPAGTKPVSLRFLPDGAHALVVANGAGKVFRLAISATDLRMDGDPLAVGPGPFSLALAPDGNTAYLTLTGGTEGAVAVVDVPAFRVAARVPVGVTPEYLALSPGGGYLQVTLVNGTNLEPGDARFREHGRMAVYATGGGTLAKVAETDTGMLCQGAGWSHDERRIFLQCAGSRRIETYRFDGRTLAAQGTPLPTAGRPGAMATRDTR